MKDETADRLGAMADLRAGGGPAPGRRGRLARRGLPVLKRGFDIAAALAALPVVGLAALVLLAVNPLWNPGSVFFAQRRMGRHCAPFTVIKFRTMLPEGAAATRGPDDPVEQSRITPLGALLRHWRIDELPQFLNVLRGDMSVVGPRPDCWDHAIHYLETVPGYRARHAVRPGITGLAQVDGGYAEGIAATIEKTALDLDYIRAGSLAMELYVIRRTVRVVLTGDGAR
jgi:lipopolysaccharide/colanic/teichoic acid biosynthesis glycosyltransferase